jgi:hypothetical protein
MAWPALLDGMVSGVDVFSECFHMCAAGGNRPMIGTSSLCCLPDLTAITPCSDVLQFWHESWVAQWSSSYLAALVGW